MMEGMAVKPSFVILLIALGQLSALPARAVEAVNYEDPNLVFTSEYVGDTAMSCPRSPNLKNINHCLMTKGLAAESEITDQTDALAKATEKSAH